MAVNWVRHVQEAMISLANIHYFIGPSLCLKMIITELLREGSLNSHCTYKPGKVLLLADSKYFSHLAVAVQIAILMLNDGHQVDFVMADYNNPANDVNKLFEKNVKKEEEKNLKNMRIIRLPVDLKFEGIFLKSAAVFSNWTTEQKSSRQPPYWELMNYHTVSIYKAIVETLQSKLKKKFEKYSTQNFFHELGLKDTVAYSATPALPAFYHFIGVKIPPTVPEHYSAEPGDGDGTSGIRNVKSERYQRNIEEYEYSIKEFRNIFDVKYKTTSKQRLTKQTLQNHFAGYEQQIEQLEKLKEIPPLSSLLSNVRYFLVNHHPLGAFPRP
uniref:Uncharacterized protein n=1 Tax=Ditylenchus dipsaci TaxID=166011 RepID=A0A915E422_9BILA